MGSDASVFFPDLSSLALFVCFGLERLVQNRALASILFPLPSQAGKELTFADAALCKLEAALTPKQLIQKKKWGTNCPMRCGTGRCREESASEVGMLKVCLRFGGRSPNLWILP